MHTTTISNHKPDFHADGTRLGMRLVVNNRVPRKLWVYSTPAMQQTMLRGTVIKTGTCAHWYRKWTMDTAI